MTSSKIKIINGKEKGNIRCRRNVRSNIYITTKSLGTGINIYKKPDKDTG